MNEHLQGIGDTNEGTTGGLPAEGNARVLPRHGTSTNWSGEFARDIGNASRSLTKIISRITATDAHLSPDEVGRLDGLDVIVGEYIRAREQGVSTRKTV